MNKSVPKQLQIVRSMRKTEELHFANRRDWRSWLEKDHEAKKEVWLISYKKHTGKPNVTYDEAVEEAICFGWIDSIVKRIDDEKFARKFTHRKPNSNWAESNKKRAQKMITQGRMTKAGLELINQARQRGQWNQDSPPPKNEISLPEYIEHAFRSSEKALANFNKLAPSYRRQYIGWVDSAKKEETRTKRLTEVIGLLERNEKLGMK
jgi:uncharacterized protein YdeI (YjbR/CyaY-like superfamily)